MHKSTKLIALLAGVVIAAAACSSSGASASPSGAASAAPSVAASASAAASPSPAAAASVDPKSLLGIVLSSGKIRVSTDPNYKPFSFVNPDGTYVGFDNSTAEETVKRLSAKLGKEITIQWETPGWDLITAGSWGGRWDISVGSMSVTVGRAKVVDFADPYYYDSGAVAVLKTSTVQTLAELNGGKTFCVGTATTYEQWLSKTLEIVDPNIVTPPTDPQVTALPTDNECIQAVQAGRKYDAIVANANGLADAVKSGAPIRILDGPPIFTVSVAFALDKSGPDNKALIALLNEIVAEMHADGSLTALSTKWLGGKDVSKKPT